MNYYYQMGKILNEDECMDLSLEILHHRQMGSLQLERDLRFYKNSYGGVTPGAWTMLERFTPTVRELTGLNLIPVNPYCRIYNNTSTLNQHTDRQDLDWTLSVCLFSNIEKDWPLIAKLGEELVHFPNNVGEASLLAGGKIEHWREELTCTEDQCVVQLMLHWKQEN